MNNIKYLKKNQEKNIYNKSEVNRICDNAYKADKERIDTAISYLAKR